MRIRSWVWSALVFTTCVLLPARASASPDLFIIIDGPGAGNVLNVLVTVGNTVTPESNEPGTSGVIALPDVGCAGDHYHGTLRGAPDPRPLGEKDPEGCGWGKVVIIDLASDLLNFLSFAIDAELDAQNAQRGVGADLVNSALAELGDFKKEVDKAFQEGKISPFNTTKLKSVIKRIESADEKVVAALDRLSKGQGKPGDEHFVGIGLRVAIREKRLLLEKLAELGLLMK